ncbi:MAG: hypothetical protein JWO10_404 [Microbacteriaceae bacterium]|nr:hypothetical protein [Microbacteriaceae bacterium]
MSDVLAGDHGRQAAIDAGEILMKALRLHIDRVASATEDDDEAEEIDRQLWDAVGAYGDALDDRFGTDDGDDDDEPDELTFTVRARYDYSVIDEKVFLDGGQGVGAAVFELLQRAGRTFPALDIDSLQLGSGLVTVHLNSEPLVPEDFDSVDDDTDLLLVDPSEKLARVITEPMYGSRAEAEAAAKRNS